MTTILKSLADLPAAETPEQERKRRVTEKLARRADSERRRTQSENDRALNALRDSAPPRRAEAVQRDRERPHHDRGQRERSAPVPAITWLDPPVVSGGFRIVGIASDATDEVKRQYGVAV